MTKGVKGKTKIKAIYLDTVGSNHFYLPRPVAWYWLQQYFRSIQRLCVSVIGIKAALSGQAHIYCGEQSDKPVLSPRAAFACRRQAGKCFPKIVSSLSRSSSRVFHI